MRRTARGRRLRWAVCIVAAIFAAVLTIVLIRLWSSADQNLAGWITYFVVFGAAWAVWETFGLSASFRRAFRRTQWVVIALVVAFATGGAALYVLWPGTASSYVGSLPAIPAVLVLLSFPRDDENVGSGDFGDGPWTAP